MPRDRISREEGYRIGYAYGQMLRIIPVQDNLRRCRTASEHPSESLMTVRRKAVRHGALTIRDELFQQLILASVSATALLPDVQLRRQALRASWEQGIDDGVNGKTEMFYGCLVARRRENLGLTQAQVSEISGYSVPMISRIEGGNCLPEQLDNYQQLLRKLELDQALLPEKEECVNYE